MDPLADKYPSAARGELRSLLLFPTIAALVGASFLLWKGATQLEGWQAWAAYAGAGALGVVIWGFRTFRPRTRWVIVLVAAVSVIGALLMVLSDEVGAWQRTMLILQLILWGTLGITFALPSTGRKFELARGRQERTSGAAAERV